MFSFCSLKFISCINTVSSPRFSCVTLFKICVSLARVGFIKRR